MSRPPDARARGPAVAQRPLVLIVDDSTANLKLARDVLSVAGFRTLTAATGAEAFAAAAEHLPDVILMDFRLPDMDGVEATRKLAMGTATARIPVVAMSSLPLGGAAWLLDAGFAGSIEKPIRVAEFPDQVRSFCA